MNFASLFKRYWETFCFDQEYGIRKNIDTVFSSSVCKDKLPNCPAFGKTSCVAPYEEWARDYCSLYCGFCTGKIYSMNYTVKPFIYVILNNDHDKKKKKKPSRKKIKKFVNR